MDYAAAVNEEIQRPVRRRRRRGADRRALHAGAAREGARSTAWRRSTARWKACTGTTAVHICFGYAAIIHERPSGYSFLPELAQCSCKQVSIETAQSNLDCSVLRAAGRQADHGRLHRPVRPRGRDARDRRRAHPRARCRYVKPENVILAPDCGMKYLPRDVGRSASCGRWSRRPARWWKQRRCCARSTRPDGPRVASLSCTAANRHRPSSQLIFRKDSRTTKLLHRETVQRVVTDRLASRGWKPGTVTRARAGDDLCSVGSLARVCDSASWCWPSPQRCWSSGPSSCGRCRLTSSPSSRRPRSRSRPRVRA